MNNTPVRVYPPKKIYNTLAVLRSMADGQQITIGNQTYGMSRRGAVGFVYAGGIVDNFTFSTCVTLFGDVTVIPAKENHKSQGRADGI